MSLVNTCAWLKSLVVFNSPWALIPDSKYIRTYVRVCLLFIEFILCLRGCFRFSDEDKSVRVYVVNFLLKLISLCDSSLLPLEIQNLLDKFLQHCVMSLTEEVCVCVCYF